MNTKKYIDCVKFKNIDDARFLLAKAKRENYPAMFINELENKIWDYEEYIENDFSFEVMKWS